MKRRQKRILLLSVAALLLVAAAIGIVWGNTALELTEITVRTERLPAAFSGYRIAHLSDLHNTEFGEDNRALLDKLKAAAPDAIMVTGDVVDSRRTDFDIAAEFMAEAVKLAPVYYATGNHESRLADYAELEQRFSQSGVTILRGSGVTIERDGGSLLVLGVDDPDFTPDVDDAAGVDATLTKLTDTETYTVLLSHRPELFDTYAKHGIDLTLSGHAHGGQIRLPFIGSIYAPEQGFFPAYTSCLHEKGSSRLVVSRGLGNSLIPVRINNRPEIVLITLERADAAK